MSAKSKQQFNFMKMIQAKRGKKNSDEFNEKEQTNKYTSKNKSEETSKKRKFRVLNKKG